MSIGPDSNILYYLAVAPQYFSIIVENLDKTGMAYREDPWRRIVIEKPFGRDLASAEELNQKITEGFPREQHI